jgi:hypothetical protein
MDPVSSAQYLILKDSFARKGVEIEAALTRAGDIDYIYVVGRLLARAENVDRLLGEVPGLRRAEEEPEVDGIVRLATDQVSIRESAPGALAVPEVLDFIDERFGISPGPTDEELPTTPLGIVYITKITPFGEPELPSGATGPWPAKAKPGGNGVKIGLPDTGLQSTFNVHSWMTNVSGEIEPPGVIVRPNVERIRPYAGHGTFAAGVAACTAPDASVYVNNHFTESEGEAEDVIVRKINELIAQQKPHLVCLPAGLYARKNAQSLPFNQLHTQHPNLTLVAAAGNDSRDKKFYPAAYPWAIGVGALATGQQTLAPFSNFGSWVDVYALGHNMVNAYAFGEYVYQEEPNAPATEIFNGIARWSGTSFAAPLVAGLIARKLARLLAQNPAATAAAAAQNVLNNATNLPNVGKAVFPP